MNGNRHEHRHISFSNRKLQILDSIDLKRFIRIDRARRETNETQVSGKWRRRKTNDRRAKIKEWYRGKRGILITSIKLIARLSQTGNRLLCWGARTLPSRDFHFLSVPIRPVYISTDVSHSAALIAIAYVYSCPTTAAARRRNRYSTLLHANFLRALIKFTHHWKLAGIFKPWYARS